MTRAIAIVGLLLLLPGCKMSVFEYAEKTLVTSEDDVAEAITEESSTNVTFLGFDQAAAFREGAQVATDAMVEARKERDAAERRRDAAALRRTALLAETGSRSTDVQVSTALATAMERGLLSDPDKAEVKRLSALADQERRTMNASTGDARDTARTRMDGHVNAMRAIAKRYGLLEQSQ